MFEEDRAPVTLTQTQDAVSYQRSIELADRRRSIFEQFLPFEHYSDIVVAVDSKSIRDYSVWRHSTPGICWLIEPNAHGYFERTVF
ncbi:MAG TPA: hypothetical protein VKN18_06175 [Blastocatellia bacterium]|nr:hypothetical protein [Blastocatellia bacterium]